MNSETERSFLRGSECVKKVVPGKFANKEIVEEASYASCIRLKRLEGVDCKEAKAINQSLSTLGLVINRLAKPGS